MADILERGRTMGSKPSGIRPLSALKTIVSAGIKARNKYDTEQHTSLPVVGKRNK